MTKHPTTMTFLEAMRSAQLDLREISKLRATLTRTEQERLGFMCPPPSHPCKLLANIDKLKAEPYIRERMANQRRSRPGARLIRRAFDPIPGQDQERMSADRRRFSAWMVFTSRAQVYVKRDVARAMTPSGMPP
jgi:hypothetical protein